MDRVQSNNRASCSSVRFFVVLKSLRFMAGMVHEVPNRVNRKLRLTGGVKWARMFLAGSGQGRS